MGEFNTGPMGPMGPPGEPGHIYVSDESGQVVLSDINDNFEVVNKLLERVEELEKRLELYEEIVPEIKNYRTSQKLDIL